MFFGNTFRQLPVNLIILVGVFIGINKLIQYINGDKWTTTEMVVGLILFSSLVLASMSHNLKFLPGNKLKSSLLLFFNKTVDAEKLSVDIKPAFWSNYSKTLMISANGIKLFSINVFDLGIDSNKNARELIKKLMDFSSGEIKMSNTVKSFIDGETDIHGRLVN